MAQLAIAAVAASAGSAAITGTVMGMTGAQIGWMAGSMIGAMLFKPDAQQGPRIEDKKVTTNVYGETIPTVWGTDRCKAQFLWSSDLIEASEEVGGKGFGGAEGVTYTYSVNVLIGVCDSPFAKPRYPLRIWGNGRLIATFNGQSWDVDEALIQRANLREYVGGPDQMPDPVYEAAVGSENAVAYRGQLSIMLEGLQLADFGNRCPNFEVEVTENITVEPCPTVAPVYADPQLPYLYKGSGGGWSHSSFAAAYDPETRRYFVLTSDDSGSLGAKQIEVYELREGAAPALQQVVPLSGLDTTRASYGGIVLDPENRKLWVVVGYGGSLFLDAGPIAAIVDADFLTVRYSPARLTDHIEDCGPQCSGIIRNWGSYTNYTLPGGDARNAGTGAAYGAALRVHPFSGDGEAGEVSWGIHGSAAINYRMVRLRNGNPTSWDCAPYPLCKQANELGQNIGWHGNGEADGAYAATSYIGDVVYVPMPPAGLSAGERWIGGINVQTRWDDGRTWVVRDNDALALGAGGASGAAFTATTFSRARRKVFILRNSAVATINLDETTGDVTAFERPFTTLASLVDTFSAGMLGLRFALWSDYHDGLLVAVVDGAAMHVVVVDPETDELIAGPCAYAGFGTSGWNGVLAPAEIGQGWFAGITPEGHKVVAFKAPGGTSMGGGVPLGNIVSELWTMAGGSVDEIDVSELTDIVPGYTLARQVAARGAIETLRGAWFFDGVESGRTFRWPKRGKAAVATIDAGELGAHVVQATGGDPEAGYELEHVEAVDAPRELTVKYIDALANYDPGTQRAWRRVGGSLAPAVLDLPIVLDTDYAAQVAWTALLLTQASKDPIRFKLGHAWEHLEPSDAITVPLSSGERQRVVITSKTSARPLVEFEGVIEDDAVWDVLFPGIERGQMPRQDGPARLEDTVLEILDLPPLRAEDDRIVAYFAMSRMAGEAWPGASAYKSVDGGATYERVFGTTAEATIGSLTTPLAGWVRGDVWDRENTVHVMLRRGTLSSASELAVYNGANAAAVGREIIQFKTAERIGENLWALSDLLRHRVGTEWAALAGHASGTRFVLLSAASLRAVAYSLADMDVARLYKGVTAGKPVADAPAKAVTLIGNSVKPLAPVHVRGERDGEGNLTITWVRRARLNAEWRDGADVPLDESSELYRVYVFTGASRSVVARTLEVTGPQWAYSAAEQTADFGAAQSTVHVSIYQVTPTYNALGHAAEAAL